MKNLSARNLKTTTRTLYSFKAPQTRQTETTTTSGGTDPTNTTLTILTTTHLR